MAGDSEKDKRLRRLRALCVMAMLREDGRAKLWHKVAHNFVEDGLLITNKVISKSNLCDLVFFLSLPSSAGQITILS